MLISLIAAMACTSSATLDDNFVIHPNGANEARLGYFPVPLKMLPAKPSNVTKEPTYRATPQYGIIHLGNGPKADYVVVLDEPTTGDWKIYIDKNQNGDLTDDGDGAWNKKTDKGRVMYGVLDVSLRASYGDATNETSSSPYQIGLYRFEKTPSPFMYRESSREGSVTIDGKTHKAILVENDVDAIYSKPVASMDEANKTRPVWAEIDLNDDGKYSSGIIDIRGPFKLGDNTYEATISQDGSKLSFAPTTKAALDLTPKQAAPKPLLKAGSAAPDFSAEKWGGGNLKLSDYKGKIVVLDFWATWCGPCQKSMPHIEHVSKSVKGQGVQVIGVCVWDEKDAYNKWVPENKSKYTFQFAFDPAGSNNASSIASKLFMVSGIPTTYIIDKNGNVADAIVGYDDGDERVEAALKKLGVKVGS